MSKKDEYITIRISKKLLKGICSIDVDNSVTLDSNLPLSWGPYSSVSVRYSSEYRNEVNQLMDQITIEAAKQKGGILHID